jgi:hypothetical protein
VVGEEVEKDGALFSVFELFGAREAGFVLFFVRSQFWRASGVARRAVAATLRRIESEIGGCVSELLLKGVGEEDSLRKFTD